MCFSRRRKCVLVTLHDSMPLMKIIDFGIAKALGPAAHRQDPVHWLRPDDRLAAVHASGADGGHHLSPTSTATVFSTSSPAARFGSTRWANIPPLASTAI
jgi:hypothetical protein